RSPSPLALVMDGSHERGSPQLAAQKQSGNVAKLAVAVDDIHALPPEVAPGFSHRPDEGAIGRLLAPHSGHKRFDPAFPQFPEPSLLVGSLVGPEAVDYRFDLRAIQPLGQLDTKTLDATQRPFDGKTANDLQNTDRFHSLVL